MSGAITIERIGWLELPGPSLAIDTSQFGIGFPPSIANIRSDGRTLSLWELSGTPRHWQFWTPGGGWSAVNVFPSDYLGPVGFIPHPDAAVPWFTATDIITSPVNAFRVHNIYANGADSTAGFAAAYWPAQSLWSVSSIAPYFQEAFGGTEFVCFPQRDAWDTSQVATFQTLTDPGHVYLQFSFNITAAIGSAFLAFDPLSGKPQSGVFTDLIMGAYTQNFGRAIAVFDPASYGPVDAIRFHSSAQNVYGALTFSSPISAFPDNVLDVLTWQPDSPGGVGPIYTNGDGFSFAPPSATVHVKGRNFEQTPYFPTTGVPGYAFNRIRALNGAQRQMRATCYLDPFYGPSLSGMMDQSATISPSHVTDVMDPNYPDVKGIIYTPFVQGFQGLPIAVDFPAGITAPYYLAMFQGVPYLLDSSSPTRFFALAMLTAGFAGLYGLLNWVRMG